ncbi:MAG: hypothetical protein ACOH2H_08665 [Cypionkella sp.]
MSDAPGHNAPRLTIPSDEADMLRATYKGVGVILEYGSGGSTLLAAESASTAVITVESDRMWFLKMGAWFKANSMPVPVILHHGDIGPTPKWGFAAKSDCWRSYSLSVWDRKDFQHPNMVLVDGRFDLAWILATMFRNSRPVRVLCDDYVMRTSYHRIETLVGPPEMSGRMAAFTFTPQEFPIAQMGRIMSALASPA